MKKILVIAMLLCPCFMYSKDVNSFSLGFETGYRFTPPAMGPIHGVETSFGLFHTVKLFKNDRVTMNWANVPRVRYDYINAKTIFDIKSSFIMNFRIK